MSEIQGVIETRAIKYRKPLQGGGIFHQGGFLAEWSYCHQVYPNELRTPKEKLCFFSVFIVPKDINY